MSASAFESFPRNFFRRFLDSSVIETRHLGWLLVQNVNLRVLNITMVMENTLIYILYTDCEHTYLRGIGGVSNEIITMINATIGEVIIEK